MEYRKDIQGLRAIAVLLVWFFHLNSNILSGGFIGVDVFFVISGYLISSIILYQKDQKKFSFKNFYINRIKRIVPAYYIYLLIITIATIAIYLPSDIINGIRKNLFNALIFNSNSYLSTIDTYFGASSNENPYLHTWTLAIEMKFYLLLPFLIYLLAKRHALFVSIFICLGLYGYGEYEIARGNQNLMYFSLLARSPEFLLGVILSLFSFTNKLSVTIQSILSSFGLTLIIASAYIFSSNTIFPGLITLIPCLGAIFILANKDSIINKKILSNPIMVYIGELSYSIYLWHWGILALIRYYNAEYTLSIIEYFFVIILTLFSSIFSYYFIEQYVKKSCSRKVFFNMSILVFSIIIFFFSFKPIYLNLKSSDKNFSRYGSMEVLGYDTYGKYEKDIIYGDIISKDTLLLLGNSHALNMTPFLDVLLKKERFAFRSITNSNFPTLPNLKSNSSLIKVNYKTQYIPYLEQMKVVTKHIHKSKCILISMQFVIDSISLLHSFERLELMLDKSQQVIVLSDFPILDKNPIRVFRDYTRKSDDINTINLIHQRTPQNILEYIDEHPNFHYLDLSDSKAFDTAPFYEDTIMYYDAKHLNEYGSLVYEKYSGDKLAKLIKELIIKSQDSLFLQGAR